jgi:hypothetical protein
MAINYTNYAALPTQGDPLWEQLIPAIKRGIELGYLPAEKSADLKKSQLENALSQIKAQYAPRMNESQLAHEGAQTNLLGEQAKYFGPSAESQMALNRSQIEAALRKSESPFKPYSNIGQLQSDRQMAVQQFGENSAQVQQIDDQINKLNTLPGKTNKANNYAQAFDQAQHDTSKIDELLGHLNTFENAYNKGAHVGPIKGAFPSSGFGAVFANTEDQIADNAQQNIVKSMLGALGSRTTNTGLQFLQSTKPSRELTPTSENLLVNNMRAVAARNKEYLPFLVEAEKVGLPLEQAETIFQDYQTKYPVISQETGKSIDKNLNKWKEFLNKSQNPMNDNLTLSEDDQRKLENSGIAQRLNIPKEHLTQENLEYTAKRKGISVDQLKKQLGIM